LYADSADLKDDFVGFLGTGSFLDTVYGRKMIKVYHAMWLFSRVGQAFFAYDYLATLFFWDVCLYAYLVT